MGTIRTQGTSPSLAAFPFPFPKIVLAAIRPHHPIISLSHHVPLHSRDSRQQFILKIALLSPSLLHAKALNHSTHKGQYGLLNNLVRNHVVKEVNTKSWEALEFAWNIAQLHWNDGCIYGLFDLCVPTTTKKIYD
jgi:hypothetical protein